MSRKALGDAEHHQLGHDSDSEGGSTDLEEEAQLIHPTAPGASTFSLLPSSSSHHPHHPSASTSTYKDLSHSTDALSSLPIPKAVSAFVSGRRKRRDSTGAHAGPLSLDGSPRSRRLQSSGSGGTAGKVGRGITYPVVTGMFLLLVAWLGWKVLSYTPRIPRPVSEANEVDVGAAAEDKAAGVIGADPNLEGGSPTPTTAAVNMDPGLEGNRPPGHTPWGFEDDPAEKPAFTGRPTVDKEPAAAGAGAAAGAAAGTLPVGRVSNGTMEFEPTVILISMDGLAARYLDRSLTPNLVAAAERGMMAKYMQSVFPSLTFPNHWSIMTGLYAESHGIVANDFYDPSTDKEFVYTVPTKSWDAEWWGGEPIWATLEKAGIPTAVEMWPGPPVMLDGTRPTRWNPFVNHTPYEKKLEELLGWLDLDEEERPRFMAVYLPEVDQEGHRTGPDSEALNATLASMDAFAASLHSSLVARNLTSIIDVIFVSDHGMTSTANERIVYLDDVLGPNGFAAIEHKEGWPSCGLRFKEGTDLEEMMDRLKQAEMDTEGGVKVYTKETMPERFHFTDNERIAPIYLIPANGWVISDKTEHLVTMKGDYHPYGNHGYDPTDPDMHAIFVAHGPFANAIKARRRQARSAIRHRPSRTRAGGKRQEPAAVGIGDIQEEEDEEGEGDDDVLDPSIVDVMQDGEGEASEQPITTIEGFENVNIYNLVMKLLAVEPAKRAQTNGTEGFWDQYLA